jgi:hypothetical protein
VPGEIVEATSQTLRGEQAELLLPAR